MIVYKRTLVGTVLLLRVKLQGRGSLLSGEVSDHSLLSFFGCLIKSLLRRDDLCRSRHLHIIFVLHEIVKCFEDGSFFCLRLNSHCVAI